jgi:hypothetical protein
MTDGRRPRRAAILTVLGWNVLPVIGLGVWVWATLAHPHTGEDWSGVIAAILVVFGGGSIVLAAGAGVAIAALVMTRRLKAGVAMGDAAGFGWGTASALLGWIVPVIVLTVYLLTQRMAA